MCGRKLKVVGEFAIGLSILAGFLLLSGMDGRAGSAEQSAEHEQLPIVNHKPETSRVPPGANVAGRKISAVVGSQLSHLWLPPHHTSVSTNVARQLFLADIADLE